MRSASKRFGFLRANPQKKIKAKRAKEIKAIQRHLWLFVGFSGEVVFKAGMASKAFADYLINGKAYRTYWTNTTQELDKPAKAARTTRATEL